MRLISSSLLKERIALWIYQKWNLGKSKWRTKGQDKHLMKSEDSLSIFNLSLVEIAKDIASHWHSHIIRRKTWTIPYNFTWIKIEEEFN